MWNDMLQDQDYHDWQYHVSGDCHVSVDSDHFQRRWVKHSLAPAESDWEMAHFNISLHVTAKYFMCKTSSVTNSLYLMFQILKFPVFSWQRASYRALSRETLEEYTSTGCTCQRDILLYTCTMATKTSSEPRTNNSEAGHRCSRTSSPKETPHSNWQGCRFRTRADTAATSAPLIQKRIHLSTLKCTVWKIWGFGGFSFSFKCSIFQKIYTNL